ncbi:MAG: hypothetical protein DGJ47_000703 [Rickettsiaceae bacterium]
MKIEKLDINELETIYGIKAKLLNIPSEAIYLGSMMGVLRPHESTRRHAHHEYEKFIIVRGKGIIIGNEKCDVVTGDICCFCPGEQHKLLNASDSNNLIFISIWWANADGAVIPLKNKTSYNKYNRIIFSPPATPNGFLHLGHIAGPYLAADILKRYYKERGTNAFHISGTDDHQSYVKLKSQEVLKSPDLVVKEFKQSIKDVFKKLQIDFDVFYNPLNNSEYVFHVSNFFQVLFTNNKIVPKTKDRPFCSKCDIWLFEAHIGGNCPHCNSSCGGGGCETCGIPNDCVNLKNAFCKRCKSSPVMRQNRQLYIVLQDFVPQLKQYYERLNIPQKVRSLLRKILDKPLLDWPITHNSDWGIKSPLIPFKSQRLCSWCEMVPAYVTSLQNKKDNYQELWNSDNCKIALFFGFDNTYFYMVVMPVLLMAYDPLIKLPTEIIYNEFYTLEDSKFSTSRSHAVWVKDFANEVPSDYIRYYLSSTRPEYKRTKFSHKHFVKTINNDLVKNLSGWINSLSGKLSNDFDSISPDGGEWTMEHEEFVQYLGLFLDQLKRFYSTEYFSPNNIIALLKELITKIQKLSYTSEYFNTKDYFDKIEYNTTIVLELTALKYYALASRPIMPNFANKVLKSLNQESNLIYDKTISLMPKNIKIHNLSQCLFSKVEL